MTSAIDTRAPGDGSAATATSSPSSVDHRQKWLRAMEATGLSDALRNTRSFAGGGQGCSDQHSPTERADAAADVMPRHVNGEASPGLRASMERVGPSTTTAALVPQAVTASPRNEMKQLPGNAFAPSTLVPTGQGEAEGELAQVGVRNSAAEGAEKTWAARNLLVLPAADGGVEIWIRDAKLSGARMQMLLSDLRRAATDIGGGSPRIFINGRPAAPAAEGRTGEGE